jgi:hypothetical protein
VLIASSAGAVDRSTLRQYGRSIAGPRALARSAAGAAIGQLRNRPREWGGGVGGFAKRFGSSLGTHAVKGAIQLGVGAWRHEDQRYYRSNLNGNWPRLKYAVVNTFVVHRQKRPGRTAAVGRLSGAFGAGLISRVWQPASTAGVGLGLASGGISVGADVGINVAREFWPRHNKPEP